MNPSDFDEQLLLKMEVLKPLLHLKPIPWKTLQDYAKKAGRSPRTLQRWLKSYTEKGIDGLRTEKPKRAGKHKKWRPFIREKYLSPKRPSIAAVHGMCEQEANAENVQAPSYKTVRRIINDIPKSVQHYHRDRRKYKDSFEVTGELFQASYPGELFLIDHRKMDVLIINGEKAVRPWITITLDQYSRCVVGYYIGFDSPSSRRVALTLRHAILPKNHPEWPMCGIPTLLRHDHGKDLISQHIQQVKIDLRISDFPKEKGNPKGNAEIERFYNTMAQWEQSLPGWTGRSIKERPAEIKPSLSLAELDRQSFQFFLDYHRKKHSITKMLPFDRWNMGVFPRLPESEKELDLLLLPVAKHYKIRRDGIHFQTNRYWTDELLPYIGETVALRYDPQRLKEIVVFVGKERIGSAFMVEGNRLTYGTLRKRRKKQATLMHEYLPSPESMQKAEKKKPSDTAETEQLLSVYNADLENHIEDNEKKTLKLFKIGDGDDWC